MALTKADLAEHLFTDLGLSKRDAKEMVEAFFEEIRLALEQGEQRHRKRVAQSERRGFFVWCTCRQQLAQRRFNQGCGRALRAAARQCQGFWPLLCWICRARGLLDTGVIHAH